MGANSRRFRASQRPPGRRNRFGVPCMVVAGALGGCAASESGTETVCPAPAAIEAGAREEPVGTITSLREDLRVEARLLVEDPRLGSITTLWCGPAGPNQPLIIAGTGAIVRVVLRQPLALEILGTPRAGGTGRLVDLDGDGLPEVLRHGTGFGAYTIGAFDLQGNQLWATKPDFGRKPLGLDLVTVFDREGDGRRELLIHSIHDQEIVLLDADGHQLGREHWGRLNNPEMTFTQADMDGDGIEECIHASDDSIVCRSRDGSELWRYRMPERGGWVNGLFALRRRDPAQDDRLVVFGLRVWIAEKTTLFRDGEQRRYLLTLDARGRITTAKELSKGQAVSYGPAAAGLWWCTRLGDREAWIAASGGAENPGFPYHVTLYMDDAPIARGEFATYFQRGGWVMPGAMITCDAGDGLTGLLVASGHRVWLVTVAEAARTDSNPGAPLP